MDSFGQRAIGFNDGFIHPSSCPLRLDRSNQTTATTATKFNRRNRHKTHLELMLSGRRTRRKTFVTKDADSDNGNVLMLANNINESDYDASSTNNIVVGKANIRSTIGHLVSKSTAPLDSCQHLHCQHHNISDDQKTTSNKLTSRRSKLSKSVNHLLFASMFLALAGATLLHLSISPVDAVPVADQAPIFSTNFMSPVGASSCPLVSACQCKWSNGKQGATCDRRNLVTIPAQLPPETQVLDMNGNNLNQLTSNVFQEKRLTNLQKIYLSECRISFIADEAFVHLTNLIELDLSGNFIQQVPSKSFGQLNHSLRKLSLAHNPIQTIEPNTFSSLYNLNTLDLSNCQLSQLKPGAFSGLEQLRELKLHDNRLTQLPINVVGDLREFLGIDLFGNPWHCDCELRQSMDWMTRHRIQQSIIPTCSTPQRHKDIRWHNVKPEEFICPPVVIDKQKDLTVGAGSNVSLACTARGSPPLTFVWFQDEKNLTTTRTNVTDPPSSTKLLEEKRYEIAEELGPPSHPNITTSILYLFNLKQSDTSLFLCWVENGAGYAVANFSLTVNDSPPATLNGPPVTTHMGSFFGLSQDEVQMGIISIAFVALLVASIIFLLMFKHTIGSSKSSQSSDMKSNNESNNHGKQHATTIGLISAANKFSTNNSIHRRNSVSTDSNDGEDDEGDDRSSCDSGSSCNKKPKVVAESNLGFIEHMRSGIINMDYHSMSPVISFNNTLKGQNHQHVNNQQAQNQLNQQPMQMRMSIQMQMPYLDTSQAMHHFPSASNASSIPYYGGANGGSSGGGNGSASMATTTSDLSPSSGGSGNTATHLASNGPITNCDLSQHRLNDLAPATNTTTTSCTSDYQSGYGGEQQQQQLSQLGQHNLHHHQQQLQLQQRQSMAPMYFEPGAETIAHGQSYSASMYQVSPAVMRPMLGHPRQQQQHGSLVMQDMRMTPTSNQRLRHDPGLHIL